MGWTAFMMGLLGSLHCIGMCGPIALALPYQGVTKIATIRNILLYNSGRIFSYGIIGILPGIIGLGFSLAGQQKSLSILIGILFIASAIFSLNLEKKFFSIPGFSKMTEYVQTRISSLLKQKKIWVFVGVGFFNGFLPCGLVYMALAGAMLRETIPSSMSYMMMFGLGTVPLMMTIALMGQIISPSIRNKLRKAIPFFMVLFGVFFILRGLHVNLPVHVQLWLENGMPAICH